MYKVDALYNTLLRSIQTINIFIQTHWSTSILTEIKDDNPNSLFLKNV